MVSRLEFILSRSRSRDLMAKVSVLRPKGPGLRVSRPDGQGLGLGLETWRPRSQESRDLMAKVSVSRPKKGHDNNTVYCREMSNQDSNCGPFAVQASTVTIQPQKRTRRCVQFLAKLVPWMFIKHNQPRTWRFDLCHRPSSEEAGTQFFRFLTRLEDVMSRKRSYAWLSW